MHKLFIFSIISGETIFCSSHQSAFDKKKELKYITGHVTKQFNEIQIAIKNKICVVSSLFYCSFEAVHYCEYNSYPTVIFLFFFLFFSLSVNKYMEK